MFPILSGNVASATAVSGNSEGIFAFGYNSTSAVYYAVSNLVSDVGVVGSDVAAVGTARRQAGACEYGEDKGIMAYGNHGVSFNVQFSIKRWSSCIRCKWSWNC
jgi:hypothetical protein